MKYKRLSGKMQRDVVLDSSIFQRMKEYKGVSTLKKAAMNILVKMADNKDIEKLREAFIAMDLDSTGDIRADELK